MQLILDFINREGKQIYKNDELPEEKSLLLLNPKEIDYEINTIKKFISQNGNFNFEEVKSYKRVDFDSDKNFYICDIEFFKLKFKDFKTDFYYNVYKGYSVLEDKNKINLNEFYLNNFVGDKSPKLSSLFKLPYQIYEFLKLIKEFPPNIQIKEEDSEKKITNEDEVKRKEEELNKDSFKFIFSYDREKTFFQVICLDASYGLKLYLTIKPYSTILTSGTLSIDLIEKLLNIKFFEKLNNDHVINKNQFRINIINGYNLYNKIGNYSFKYLKRDDIDQITSLGNEIFNLVKSVKKGGVLVFFQSKEYLLKCYKIWLENEIIKKCKSIKDVVFDLSFYRQNSEEIIKKKKNNKLLFFTVYRGRNSEGINFQDDEARMVICIGMPYPKLTDIKVILKKDYLDERHKKENKNFNGWKWYKEEAINAVNQSLGRLIRHKNDYGIMICFGIDFSRRGIHFSKWINDNISQNSFIRLKENDINYFNGLESFLTNLNKEYSKYLINQEKNNLNEYEDYLNEILDYEFSDDNNDIIDNDNYNGIKENLEKDKSNTNEKDNYIKEYDYKDYGLNLMGYKRNREKNDNDDNEDDLI